MIYVPLKTSENLLPYYIDSSSSNQELEPICSHGRGLELCKTMRPPFWTAIDGLKQTECTWVSLRIAYLLNLMINHNQTDYCEVCPIFRQTHIFRLLSVFGTPNTWISSQQSLYCVVTSCLNLQCLEYNQRVYRISTT
jgi:hypothetical protein